MNAQDRQKLAELAPFYVAGTLANDERAGFERALAEDPDLARNVEAARAERDEVIALNEALPAPGARASEKLFALLDAEPARAPGFWRRLDLGARLAEWFSPRALGWVAMTACLLVAVEAGFLAKPSPVGSYATASRDEVAPVGRLALVAFNPDARADQIADLLAQNGAQIVGGPRAGFFQVRLGDKDMSEAQAASKLDSLKASGLVRSALKKGES
ncbi:hypothetical protein CCR94_11605 [Rhodoblastus sphagnicola]|uniref:Zinc-finger domain-containing protein n=1 Tax=Rhodoblastus sphagnicola TaxID=333368 RepID=A0A2S6N7X3_9HYPH|nr:hypothetical protein [Rhodoblastus sphagnicola]MBB4197831.1 anti-sigma factor RsiW [Rhodoblastus sphagnicola]PPQ30706.1 hypothetical protein CCR94_11605 [Rhodoblastus sphagnicola]